MAKYKYKVETEFGPMFFFTEDAMFQYLQYMREMRADAESGVLYQATGFILADDGQWVEV